MKLMTLALIAGMAYPIGIRAQEQDALDTFVFDPHNARHEGANGNAAIVLKPRFDDANRRTVGMFCHPVIARWASEPEQNLTCYNLKIGDATKPVPNGAKGKPSGYQANIDTDQSRTDTGRDGAQGYGASLVLRNGAGFHAFAAGIATMNKPADGYAFDVNIDNFSGGGHQIGFNAGSGGGGAQFPADTAFNVIGKWSTGLNLGGHDMVGATTVAFAAPGSKSSLDYRIDGSQADTLRIVGGGKSQGMLLYGSSRSGGAGPIRFRDNPEHDAEAASIDTSSGDIFSRGNVIANAVVLKSPDGHCWKVTIDDVGTLKPMPTQCTTR
jgi:hypothetical protein